MAGNYEVVFNSNASKYGGEKRITKKTYKAENMQFSDMMYTIQVAVDGNSVMFIKRKPDVKKKTASSKTKTAPVKSKTTAGKVKKK